MVVMLNVERVGIFLVLWMICRVFLMCICFIVGGSLVSFFRVCLLLFMVLLFGVGICVGVLYVVRVSMVSMRRVCFMREYFL